MALTMHMYLSVIETFPEMLSGFIVSELARVVIIAN